MLAVVHDHIATEVTTVVSTAAVLRCNNNNNNEIIILIFINCNWVDTRWQWLFYVCTCRKKMEKLPTFLDSLFPKFKETRGYCKFQEEALVLCG
jgi:hypothetical protein